MYDPKAGRWLSLDPIGFQAGDEDLYRYVANNPVDLIDPSGLDSAPPQPLQAQGPADYDVALPAKFHFPTEKYSGVVYYLFFRGGPQGGTLGNGLIKPPPPTGQQPGSH
jgi:hypothetical protein